MKIVTLLKAVGYEIELNGDKIKYRYTLPGDPPEDKVKPLLDELRKHKDEVVTHLKIKKESETPVPSVPTIKEDTLLKMPLSEFKKGGYLVRVRCRHLNNEEIYIASTEREAAIGRAEGLIVYLADELIELVKDKPNPDVMRTIHEAKKILQGTLLETRERGNDDGR